MGKVIMSGIVPQLTTPWPKLGDIAEGSTIKLMEDGHPEEFYVAKHNYESALNGAGRTLLVRKEWYDVRVWHNSQLNAYASSDIDTWLNGDYKALLDEEVQDAIATTKFYYTPGNGTTSVSTLSRRVFLLSATELGGTGDNVGAEGATLPTASLLTVASRNGVLDAQWTRSPSNKNAWVAWCFNTSGAIAGNYCDAEAASRPAFTLPSDFKVMLLEAEQKKVWTVVTDAYGGESALLSSKGALTIGETVIATTTEYVMVDGNAATIAYQLTGDIGAVRSVAVNGTTIGSVHYAGDSVSTTIAVSDGDTITVTFT